MPKARRGWIALLVAVLAAIALHCTSSVSIREPAREAVRERTVRQPDPVIPRLHRSRLPVAREILEGDVGLIAAYPPIATAMTLAGASVSPTPLPLVFMLHGACGEPLGVCSALGAGGRAGSWLVCPQGNVPCGEDFDWRGDGETKARHLDAVGDTMRRRWHEHVSEPGGDILVGFSRGAFVARDVAYARPGRYRGIVFIGAALTPDPERLKASGIRRVVLASGDKDDARGTMLRATAVLLRGGVEARFVSLGPIYHQLPRNLDEVMAPELEWIREG